MPNEIKIFGEVGEQVTADEIRNLLDSMDQTEPLTVRIDSPGGDVRQGFAIYTALKNYPGKKTAIVESSAFSIASYIPMACDEIEMASNGYFMIHNPMVQAIGDDDDLAQQSELLAKLKNDMVAAYSERTGMDADAVLTLMKAETYFDARESVSSGFADRVQGREVATRISAMFTNSMPHGVVASLRGEQPDGNQTSPMEIPMSDKPRVAATVKQIKAAFPKAKSDFVVKCMEQELTEEEVTSRAMEELMAENEELMAKVASMEEMLEESKAKAMEEEEEAKAKAMEEEEAKAKARGNSPVAVGTGSAPSATVRWNDAVASYQSKGFPKAKAVSMANKKNPGLREQFLQEANA